ncbi:MAG: hypothetical protein L3K16_09345 [Thermoplasmata archaeon]|nr:hypothetical protein [Thermoplasmata archaeon]
MRGTPSPLGSLVPFEWATFDGNVTVVGLAEMGVMGSIVPLGFNHLVYCATGMFGTASYRMTPEWEGTAYEIGVWSSDCGEDYPIYESPCAAASNASVYVSGSIGSPMAGA